jgi:hypothetical protein
MPVSEKNDWWRVNRVRPWKGFRSKFHLDGRSARMVDANRLTFVFVESESISRAFSKGETFGVGSSLWFTTGLLIWKKPILDHEWSFFDSLRKRHGACFRTEPTSQWFLTSTQDTDDSDWSEDRFIRSIRFIYDSDIHSIEMRGFHVTESRVLADLKLTAIRSGAVFIDYWSSKSIRYDLQSILSMFSLWFFSGTGDRLNLFCSAIFLIFVCSFRM